MEVIILHYFIFGVCPLRIDFQASVAITLDSIVYKSFTLCSLHVTMVYPTSPNHRRDNLRYSWYEIRRISSMVKKRMGPHPFEDFPHASNHQTVDLRGYPLNLLPIISDIGSPMIWIRSGTPSLRFIWSLVWILDFITLLLQ